MNNGQANGGIFINYRQRDGSNGLHNHALLVEALSHRLARHFGQHMVFVDTSMSSGTRYPDELRAKLTTCHVLLAIIHPEWLEDLLQRQGKSGPDWVLDELSIAFNGDLDAKNRITQRPVVIPVLLERAELPDAEELPGEIQMLADMQPFRFRSGSLADDMARLIDELESRVPASWQPRLEKEMRISEGSVLPIIMVVLTVVAIGVQLINIEFLVILLVLLMMCMIIATATLFLAIVFWAFRRQMYWMEEQIMSAPMSPQNRLIAGFGILGGAVIMPYYLYLVQNVPSGQSTYQSATKSAFMYLIGFLILLLFTMALIARQLREDSEWPPSIPTQRVPDRMASLRGAIVLLEQRLTSSWRPPLSRVQRDQAQHIIQQLSKAATTLRSAAERSRLDWLRTDHRRVAVAYLILLAGTVCLAVTTAAYLLIGLGNTGKWVYLAVLTAIFAPAMCCGAAELWFRYERMQMSCLAAEIEENIEKRLLLHLPRRRADLSSTAPNR